MSRIRDDITRLTACLTTPAETPRDRPELLTLLLGHLPIRAGLWRLPAARVLFPDASRVMVVREDEEHLVLECLGEGFEPISDELIPDCSACVFVPHSGASHELVGDLDSDRLAIITGGDQAAIVAAYAMIKGLSVPLEVPVELIVVGQEEAEGRETGERLAEAVLRHLGRQVDYRGSIPSIGADTGLTQSKMVPRPLDGLLSVAHATRGRVKIDEKVDREARHRVVTAPVIESCESEHVAPERPGSMPVEPLPPGDTVMLQPAPVIMADQPTPATAPINPRAVEADVSGIESAESSASWQESEAGSQPESNGLSVHLPGLQSLLIKCPDHQNAEFALDHSGSLHLVVPASEAGVVPAILGWTLRHWSLLSQAVPELSSTAVDPVVHVVGEDAQSLLEFRDTPWRTHLLVPVVQAGPDGFACVSLSREVATPQGR